MVPENNCLLRCLQFLNEEVAYGNYCWNGDCRNCQIVIRRDPQAQEVTALACLTKVVAGLHIVRLPLGLTLPAETRFIAPLAEKNRLFRYTIYFTNLIPA